MIHELKTSPKYFDAIANGSKTFEVRKNDRDFKVGDFLALNEFINDSCTGRCLIVHITYILDNAEYCKDGFCIIGFIGCAIKTKYELYQMENNSLNCMIPIYENTQ